MGKKHTDKATQNTEPARLAEPSSSLPKHLAETAWRVALPFIIFSLAGIKLDDILDSSPIFSILGLVIALFAVSIVVYKYVNKYFPGTFGGDKHDK